MHFRIQTLSRELLSTLLAFLIFNSASGLTKKIRMASEPGSGAILYFLDLRI